MIEQTLTATPINLDDYGVVPDTYQHHQRVVRPGAPLVTSGAVLKWYDLTLDDWEIPAGVEREARELLQDDPLFNDGIVGHGLGFVVAHYTTAGAFAIAGVWCNHNELWTAAWWRVHGPDNRFERVERDAGLAPVYCVWELGAVCYERHAWHRFLFSAQDAAAKIAWLGDTLSGTV